MDTRKDLEFIKLKVIDQIKSSFPEDQQEKYLSKINSMNREEFIQFLKNQGILKENQEQKCLFCSIVFGEIPSTKIDENERAIAILELNPISEGHTIIVPKEHLEEENKIPKEAYDLAKTAGEKIVQALKPKDIKIYETEVMKHRVLNLLPIYNHEDQNSKRSQKTPEQLEELKKRIISKEEKKKESSVQEKPIEINEKNTWLPKRIP